MPLIKGQYPVIEQIGCHQGILPVIDLGETHFAVSIDKCLLVNPPHPLEGPHIERILGPKVSRMLGLDLPEGLFLFLAFSKAWSCSSVKIRFS